MASISLSSIGVSTAEVESGTFLSCSSYLTLDSGANATLVGLQLSFYDASQNLIVAIEALDTSEGKVTLVAGAAEKLVKLENVRIPASALSTRANFESDNPNNKVVMPSDFSVPPTAGSTPVVSIQIGAVFSGSPTGTISMRRTMLNRGGQAAPYTPGTTTSGGDGSVSASSVLASTGNFDNLLGPSDDTVQKALDTLDNVIQVDNYYSGDVDSITTSGFYFANGSSTNKPANGVMLHGSYQRDNNSYDSQLLVSHATDSAYFRSKDLGVWESWKEFWHEGNFDPATKASLSGADFLSDVTVSGDIVSSSIRTYTAQELVLNAGESINYATGQTNEYVYINAESGLEINSSPDNWASGWTSRFTATICDQFGNSYLPGTLTVGNGKANSSIYMDDSDQGARQIHCNSNRIGFLTSGGSWSAYSEDGGKWVCEADAKVTGNLEADGGLSQDGDVILNGTDTWLRTTGDTGWFSTTHGGGIYMTDSTYIRTYASKALYATNSGADSVRSIGGFAIDSGHGKGYRFWNSDLYKVYMSSSASEPYGVIELDTNPDYNMYFRMAGSADRGFVFWNDTSSTTAAAQIMGDGQLLTRGTMKASSWGNGTSLSKVMTWEDFTYQDDPPAGLEDVINANWIQAGAIRAHHVQVSTSGDETGNTSGVKVEINPLAESPINIRDKTTDETVFAVTLVDGQSKAVVNGTGGTDFISSASAITDDVKRAINPYFLGAGGSADSGTGSMASGATSSFTVTTGSDGLVAVDVNLSASGFSATVQNYIAPEWTVKIYRGTTSGTLLYNKTHKGTATEEGDPKEGEPIFSQYYISIVDGIVDTGAVVSGSQTYTLEITRVSGTPTTLTRNEFSGSVPSFLTNDIDTVSTGGYSWTDKETGFTVKGGSVSVVGDGTSSVTFTDAFNSVYSATVTSNNTNLGEWAVGSITVLGLGSLTIQNQDANSHTFRWMAIGYTAV